MPKFKIVYFFDGDGVTKIKAKNKKEAREKFYDGDISEECEREQGSNYTIKRIEKI